MKRPFNPANLHRRTIRLKGYDYTQPGAYYITIVTWQRECLFGLIENNEVILNNNGQCAQVSLEGLSQRFEVKIDSFVIMPNHVHVILILNPRDEHQENNPGNKSTNLSALPRGTISGSLGAIIQNYKSITTRRINLARDTPGALVWQQNYYEHIIRTEEELARIRLYIAENPWYWAEDSEAPTTQPSHKL